MLYGHSQGGMDGEMNIFPRRNVVRHGIQSNKMTGLMLFEGTEQSSARQTWQVLGQLVVGGSEAYYRQAYLHIRNLGSLSCPGKLKSCATLRDNASLVLLLMLSEHSKKMSPVA